jgi:predicted CoA-substrate-specific enzyme activase
VFAGIDSGSTTTKAALIEADGTLLAFQLSPTGYDRDVCAHEVLHQALELANRERHEIQKLVATGYGRRAISFADDTKTEILCHASGTSVLYPHVRTIIDIGGQDSKIISLDKKGQILKFEMNDKCAAGTGRFLDVLSQRILGVDVSELGDLARKSLEPCSISSVCTVFAETEIISYLSVKRPREDIAQGLHQAIARRVIAMGHRALIKYQTAIVFTGGVAQNQGVVEALGEELGQSLLVPNHPQLPAALGAAHIATRSHEDLHYTSAAI